MYDPITKQKYKRHLANKLIAWHFNTLLTTPQGSAWERMIRSIRKLLTALPDDQQSTTVSIDDLHMMLAGAQRILNARPLTAITISVDNHNAIMPKNFITNTTDISAMIPILLACEISHSYFL